MNWVSIGSGNGLSPVRRQTITGNNAGALWIEPLGTNFSEIWIDSWKCSWKCRMRKWQPFVPGRWINIEIQKPYKCYDSQMPRVKRNVNISLQFSAGEKHVVIYPSLLENIPQVCVFWVQRNRMQNRNNISIMNKICYKKIIDLVFPEFEGNYILLYSVHKYIRIQ